VSYPQRRGGDAGAAVLAAPSLAADAGRSLSGVEDRAVRPPPAHAWPRSRGGKNAH
jgi:hypothetical protein